MVTTNLYRFMPARSWLWWDWLVLALSCTLVMAAVASHPAFVAFTTSSDQLTIPSLYWDVVEHSLSALTGWQFSRAPYLFPDLPIYALSRLITADLRQAIFLACLIQLVATCGIVGLVVNRMTGTPPARAGLVFLFIITIFTGLTLFSDLISDEPRSFFRISMYNYEFCSHYASFIMAMLGAVLIFDYLIYSRRSGIRWLLPLVVLATVSDFIFALYLVIPLAVVVLAAGRAEGLPRQRVATVVILLMVGAGVGRAIMATLNLQPLPTYKLHLSNLGAGTINLIHLLPPTSLVYLAVFWLPILALIGGGVWAVRRWGLPSSPEHRHFRLWTGFLALAVLANLGFEILYLAREDDVLLRYLAMATTAPPLFLTALVFRSGTWGLASPGFWRAPAVAAFTLYASFALARQDAMPALLRWMPAEAADLAACVDRHHLKAGLAGYYLSRRLMAALDWSLPIHQLEPERPVLYYWGNNLKWFSSDFSNPERPPTYDFIITNRFDYTRHGAFGFVLAEPYPDSALIQSFGPPSEVVTCGALRLALYRGGEGINRAVTEFLAQPRD